MSLRTTIETAAKDRIRRLPAYQQAYNWRHARQLATRGKRLDVCAAEVAQYLLQAGRGGTSLNGAVCLEVGSGWLLTHSLVFHLLGASKVYATDVEPLLQPASISQALAASVDWAIVDSLCPFDDRSAIEQRLERLLAVDRFSPEQLRELSIEYVAPIDLARDPLPGSEPLDLVFSKSVLEHVPVDDVEPLLRGLTGRLSPTGMMFHLIHLVDHRDLRHDPFAFLALDGRSYPPDLQTRWGNRIRASRWLDLFGGVDGIDTEVVFEWSDARSPLPDHIDPLVSHQGEADLRVTHLGVCNRARG